MEKIFFFMDLSSSVVLYYVGVRGREEKHMKCWK